MTVTVGSYTLSLTDATPEQVDAAIEAWLAAAPLATPDPLDGTRAAIVIATATHQDPGLATLRSPVHNSETVAAVLGDPDIGRFDVETLFDCAADQIRQGLERFLHDRGPTDIIVVYFTGHGIRDRQGRLYFAATDTQFDDLETTAIQARWLADRLGECRSRRQVVILDCCYSGAFVGGGELADDIDRQVVGSRPPGTRMVLTASRQSEIAFDVEPTVGATAGGSVFTAGLVEGLRTGLADLDRDGFISVNDAFHYAYQYVRTVGTAQTPQFSSFADDGRPIWLARNPFAAATVGRDQLPSAAPATTVAREGHGTASRPVHFPKPEDTVRQAAFDEGEDFTGRLLVTLSWYPNDSPPGIEARLAAFQVDEDAKVPVGKPFYIVHFASDLSKDDSAVRTGRRRRRVIDQTESIVVSLDQVDEDIKKIVFVAYIQDATQPHHTFSQLKDSLVAFYGLPAGDGPPDASSARRIYRHPLDSNYDDASLAVEVGEVYRSERGAWKYRNISQGRRDLVEVAAKYGVTFVRTDQATLPSIEHRP